MMILIYFNAVSSDVGLADLPTLRLGNSLQSPRPPGRLERLRRLTYSITYEYPYPYARFLCIYKLQSRTYVYLARTLSTALNLSQVPDISTGLGPESPGQEPRCDDGKRLGVDDMKRKVFYYIRKTPSHRIGQSF